MISQVISENEVIPGNVRTQEELCRIRLVVHLIQPPVSLNVSQLESLTNRVKRLRSSDVASSGIWIHNEVELG